MATKDSQMESTIWLETIWAGVWMGFTGAARHILRLCHLLPYLDFRWDFWVLGVVWNSTPG